MGKIKEFFTLLIIKIVVTVRNIEEFILDVIHYYPNKKFRKADIYLLRNYILRNPYKIAKEYLIKKGEKDIYSYGETPLTTLEKVSEICGIKSSDIVYELGSGRGRSCFWLHYFKGCTVTGIEYVPDFVHIAQKTQRLYAIKGVNFLYGDMMEIDFSDATVVYYYGTCAETSFIMQLISKLKRLAPGTKIITVSYPLTTYTTEPLFDLVKTFPAKFTWGYAQVYLHKRR